MDTKLVEREKECRIFEYLFYWQPCPPNMVVTMCLFDLATLPADLGLCRGFEVVRFGVSPLVVCPKGRRRKREEEE